MLKILKLAAPLWIVAAASTSPAASADSYEKIGGKCMYCCCTPKQCKESSQPGNCGMSAKDNSMSSPGGAKANVDLMAPPRNDAASQPPPKNGNH